MADIRGIRSPKFRSAFLWRNLLIIGGLFVVSVLAFLLFQVIGSGVIRFGLQRFFHDVELSIPTLYNFFLLALNFGLLAAIAVEVRVRGTGHAGAWIAMAVIFLLLTYDEAAEVHEDIARGLRDHMPSGPFLTYAWTPIGAVAVVLFVIAFRPFLRDLPRQVSRLMVLAGGLYVFGALVVETAGGWFDFHFGQDLRYHVISAIEESFEMGGMVVMAYALLSFMALSAPAVPAAVAEAVPPMGDPDL